MDYEIEGEERLGRSGLPERNFEMILITLDRPLVGEPLLPCTTHRTRSRFGNFLIASGLSNVGSNELNESVAAGFHADREAGVVVTATSCDRPLFFDECKAGQLLNGINQKNSRRNFLTRVGVAVSSHYPVSSSGVELDRRDVT